jgi:uncharacterized membrane protein YoaK (UPF0700 family)
MSGNMVQSGLSLGKSFWPLLLRAGSALGAFLFGAILGGILFARSRFWAFPVCLLLEAAAVALGAWLMAFQPEQSFAIIALLAFGMGAQNHLVSKSRIDNSGTTFVTGTLFRFGDALARRLVSNERSGLWLAYLLVWLSGGLPGLACASGTPQRAGRGLAAQEGTWA